MRNTKTITTSAMLLALIGALFLLNRAFAFFFDPIAHTVSALIILIEIVLYGYKMGLVVSFGALIMGFLFGGSYILIYTPLAILAAFAYGFAVAKRFGAKEAVAMTSVIYIIGEFIITLLIMPLLGIDTISDLSTSLSEMFKEMGFVFDAMSFENLIKVSLSISLALTGFLEGLLLHLLAKIIFKRFHISTLPKEKAIVLRPLHGYIAMFLVFGFIFVNSREINDIIYYVVSCLGLLAAVVLIFSGYTYFVSLGNSYRMNFSLYLILIIVLLFPYSLLILIITGFLYITGPLKNTLNRR